MEATFKERHQNYKIPFTNRGRMKGIELSKYICSLRDQNKILRIKRSIDKKVNSRTKLNYCKLCLFEKLFLIKSLGDPR